MKKYSDCDIKKEINKKFTVCDSIDLSKYCICTDSIVETTVCLANTDYKIIKYRHDFDILAKGVIIVKIKYCDNCCGRLYCKCLAIPFMKLVKIPPCSKVLKCTTNLIYYDICKCGKQNLLIYALNSFSLLISKDYGVPQMSYCCHEECKPCPPVCYNTNCNKNCNNDCYTDIEFRNDCYPDL